MTDAHCPHHEVLFLLVILAHGDGILRWDHVPQSVTAKDNVLVLLGIDGVHTSVRFRGHDKFTTVEVVAPQIT